MMRQCIVTLAGGHAIFMLAIMHGPETRPHIASDETCLSILAGELQLQACPLMMSNTAWLCREVVQPPKAR